MEARRELIDAVGERYRQAGWTEKKQILDEFVELAGFHRKHAIRVLRSERRPKVPGPGMTTRPYDEAVMTALTIIWEAADRICGKRLKAVLPTFVESMERNGHLCLDPAVKDRLLRTSAATIDRLLRPIRALAKQGRRKVSVNTPTAQEHHDPDVRGLEQSAARLLRDGPGGPLRKFGGRQSCA